MRRGLKLIFVFPPFHSFMSSASVSGRKMLCVWTSRPIRYSPTSPFALPNAFRFCCSGLMSPFLCLTQSLLSALICVWVVFSCLFLAISLSLSSPVSPLYIYMRVLGHTVAFIHVCVLRCIIVLPVFLVPFSLASQCVSFSLFLQYLLNHWSSTSG